MNFREKKVRFQKFFHLIVFSDGDQNRRQEGHFYPQMVWFLGGPGKCDHDQSEQEVGYIRKKSSVFDHYLD